MTPQTGLSLPLQGDCLKNVCRPGDIHVNCEPLKVARNTGRARGPRQIWQDLCHLCVRLREAHALRGLQDRSVALCILLKDGLRALRLLLDGPGSFRGDLDPALVQRLLAAVLTQEELEELAFRLFRRSAEAAFGRGLSQVQLSIRIAEQANRDPGKPEEALEWAANRHPERFERALASLS